MSTIKSSAEHLTLNADGANNDIIFQSNGTTKATLDQAGLLTATTFAGSGASLTALPAANITGTLPAIDGSNLTGISGGKVLQVVAGRAATDRMSTTSTSFVQLGATVSITPSATSSKILVMTSLSIQKSAQYSQVFDFARNIASAGWTQNLSGGSGGIVSQSGSDVVNWTSTSYQFLDSPSTTSAIQYGISVKVSNSALTSYFNDHSAGTWSPLTLIEIGA